MGEEREREREREKKRERDSKSLHQRIFRPTSLPFTFIRPRRFKRERERHILTGRSLAQGKLRLTTFLYFCHDLCAPKREVSGHH